MLTAVLGVLKAGGHYVPLDDSWPAGRVESILAATGASAIVVAGSLLPAVEEMRWRLPALSDVVCLDVAAPGAAGRGARCGERRRAVGLRGGAGGGPGDGGRLRQRLHGPAVQRGRGRRVPRPRAGAHRPLAAAGRPRARDRQRLGAAALGAGLPGGARHRPRSLAADSRRQPRARGAGRDRQRRAAHRLRSPGRRSDPRDRAVRPHPARQHRAVLPRTALLRAGDALGARAPRAGWRGARRRRARRPAARGAAAGDRGAPDPAGDRGRRGAAAGAGSRRGPFPGFPRPWRGGRDSLARRGLPQRAGLPLRRDPDPGRDSGPAAAQTAVDRLARRACLGGAPAGRGRPGRRRLRHPHLGLDRHRPRGSPSSTARSPI